MFSKYSVYQWNNPTALLLIGEFVHFTDTDIKQVKDSIKEVGQVCLQISNACSGEFEIRKENIKLRLGRCGISYNAKYTTTSVPFITLIVDNNDLLQR